MFGMGMILLWLLNLGWIISRFFKKIPSDEIVKLSNKELVEHLLKNSSFEELKQMELVATVNKYLGWGGLGIILIGLLF